MGRILVMDSYYSQNELNELGLGSFGENVKLSRKCSIYSPEKLHLGDNVRIDDFCFLSGNIVIGSHVHIGPYVAMYGGDAGIKIENFAGVSSRVAIYAESDDYSGNYLHNPNIPEKYKNVISGSVIIGRHVDIGTGSTILPATVVGEGSTVGAMSLVKGKLKMWSCYFGIPCRRISERNSKKILELEREYLRSNT